MFSAQLLQWTIVTIQEIMDAHEDAHEMGTSFFARPGLILLALALVLTGISWLFLSQHNPMPCSPLKLS